MKRKDYVPGLRVFMVRDASTTLPAVVDCARAAAAVARGFIPQGEEREHFLAVLLDARGNAKGVCVVSIGTLSASLVHPREFFRPAIVAGAAAVVAIHNHPSGDPAPSVEDKDVTTRLRRAGELLGIPLSDHVIIGAGETFFSFHETGML
ncbi:MAG: JAB domain-containing protein [Patescibacteria group bacterium]|nr:JAB domain-containing protein [Patescibacteria group bacterium]